MDGGTKKFALAVAGITGVVCIVVVASKGSSPTSSTAAVTSASPEVKAAPTGEFPSTISRDWCEKLGLHIEPRLRAEAQEKYPGRDLGVVHDHVLNTVHNCTESIGKPLTPTWKCRWNATLEPTSECEAVETDVKGCKDACKVTRRECERPARDTNDAEAFESCVDSYRACNSRCERTH